MVQTAASPCTAERLSSAGSELVVVVRSVFHMFGRSRLPENPADSIHQAAMRPLCKVCKLSASYTCTYLAEWATQSSLSEVTSICLTTNNQLSRGPWKLAPTPASDDVSPDSGVETRGSFQLIRVCCLAFGCSRPQMSAVVSPSIAATLRTAVTPAAVASMQTSQPGDVKSSVNAFGVSACSKPSQCRFAMYLARASSSSSSSSRDLTASRAVCKTIAGGFLAGSANWRR